MSSHSARKSLFLFRQRLSGKVSFIHINKCGGTSVEAAMGIPKIHDTARERVARISPARWRQMYTFGLVRHPYSRMCSYYEYSVKMGFTGLSDRHLDVNGWIAKVFVERDYAYRNKPKMFLSCVDWLADWNGDLWVDDWFKLEELDEKWPVIKDRARISGELPRKNTTAGFSADKALEKLTQASVDALNTAFAEDFARFGYHKA
ncbi:MAG: sulfotransferase family 2 domain-containing protein [Alteraurantiacibacter sp.]